MAVALAALAVLGVVQFTRSTSVEAATPADGLSSTPSKANTLQWTNAFLAAQVSNIAYEDSAAVRATELAKWGLREVRFHKPGSGTEVLVAESPGPRFVFIGVRGTQEFRDVLTDAVTTQTSPSWDRSISLHGGFLNSANAAWAAVLSEVSLSNALGATVFLTGHSLGGAVAHILAFRLAGAGLPFHSVTTFGAPIAGTTTWASKYNSRLADRTHDFVNKADPMQCLPSNPIKRWDSVIGRHYHLGGTTVVSRDDSAGCSQFHNIADALRIGVVDRAVTAVRGVCDRVKRKGWRRFLKAVLPGICRAGPFANAIGAITGLMDLTRLGGMGDHAMEEYIKSLRGAMPATRQEKVNIERPSELRNFTVDGKIAGVSQARTEPFGWTSIASFTQGGRPFVAKASDERGIVRVDEIGAAGTVARTVADTVIPYGFNVVGTYNSGSSTFVVFLGAGHVMVRAVGTDGRVGAETAATPVIDDVPIDVGTFAPTKAVVYDVDGSTGPQPPRVLAYDEENGQYRVRSLGPNGTVGGETARGQITAGYTELTAFWVLGGQRVLFVSETSGAMELRQVDNDTGELGFLYQAVAGGGSMAGIYDGRPGWSSVAIYGGEYGTRAVFHNGTTGATDVVAVDNAGALSARSQTLTMAPGWTDLARVSVPATYGQYLVGVRR
jgi:triacylglycerol lipase